MQYWFGGVEKLLSLGSYPDVSLKRAREKRDEARRLLADGVDPSAKKKAEKLSQADTFAAIAAQWPNLQRKNVLREDAGESRMDIQRSVESIHRIAVHQDD